MEADEAPSSASPVEEAAGSSKSTRLLLDQNSKKKSDQSKELVPLETTPSIAASLPSHSFQTYSTHPISLPNSILQNLKTKRSKVIMSAPENTSSTLDLAAPEINNLGVDWYRSGDLTTSFQFFYHSIERFKAGRASAFPPAAVVAAAAVGSSDTFMEDTNQETSPASPISSVVEASAAAAAAAATTSSAPTTVSPTRARLESVFANDVLFKDQVFRCPFRISYSSESQLYYFSPEPTQDYILCSCIAVFNMAVTVFGMDDATALQNHIQNRHEKVKGLFQHCLQLLSLVLDPVVVPLEGAAAIGKDGLAAPTIAVSQAAHLNVVTLATCDLLALACLNNLIVMTIDDELPSECSPVRNAHLETLLRTVTSVRAERYGHDSEVTAIMARMADMFLVTVFFILKFPPGPAAAAA